MPMQDVVRDPERSMGIFLRSTHGTYTRGLCSVLVPLGVQSTPTIEGWRVAKRSAGEKDAEDWEWRSISVLDVACLGSGASLNKHGYLVFILSALVCGVSSWEL